MVANGDKITQTAEGIVPFNVPAAAHVAVFKKTSNVLLAAGPLVKAGCYIILDTPQAQVIDKKTGTVILTAESTTVSNVGCLSLQGMIQQEGTMPTELKLRRN